MWYFSSSEPLVQAVCKLRQASLHQLYSGHIFKAFFPTKRARNICSFKGKLRFQRYQAVALDIDFYLNLALGYRLNISHVLRQ